MIYRNLSNLTLSIPEIGKIKPNEEFDFDLQNSGENVKKMYQDDWFIAKNESFSQFGEDFLAKKLFDSIGISQPSYIDVGAFLPTELSNTYLFYLAGSQGILIEPNPECISRLKEKRPRDIVCNMAIGTSSMKDFASLDIMTAHSLSTISEKESKYITESKAWGEQSVTSRIEVQVKTLNQVMQEYFVPDFLSIDTEGLDLEIIKDTNLWSMRPKVICIETWGGHSTYTKSDLISAMHKMDYEIFEFTCLNALFCSRSNGKTMLNNR